MAQVTDTHKHSNEDAGHHGVGHIVSPKILIANTIALLVLTVITVAVAKIDFMEYNIHELNMIVALGVAVVKASLVCLFFMHLYWDRPFNGFVLVGSIAFVALFMVLAMMDTSEYRSDIVPGDSRGVVERINAAEQRYAPGSTP
ncbi:MAG TPA: cytochrome C oxidase subunit IV family protein [Phycisphaerales bacterium]|nr:cytochrome C oxidase subunit IV family protein [Phycisphaerales bacterium]HRQ76608.1 cytochrome C oxidase subunit IV family protein [Phycisphaerales bacterium]